MLATPMKTVTPRCMTVSTMASGLKRGRYQTVAPSTSGTTVMAVKPKLWNWGRTLRKTCSGVMRA